MAGYLTEYDRHLSFLVSGSCDEKERAAAIAHDISHLEHGIHSSNECFDQVTHDSAVTLSTKEPERLRTVRDKENAKAEAQSRGK